MSLKKSLEEAFQAASIYKKPETLLFVERFAELLAEAFGLGRKLLVCGNGGSLCDAMHVAEEFTGQFRSKRKALPAIALADPSHLSCVANDMGFEQVFARGVEAFGQEGDVLLLLTTSGNSANMLEAVSQAKAQGLITVALLGKGGGVMKGLSDLELIVDGFKYSDRIQEIHMTLMHIVIEGVEKHLFFSENAYLCR